MIGSQNFQTLQYFWKRGQSCNQCNIHGSNSSHQHQPEDWLAEGSRYQVCTLVLLYAPPFTPKRALKATIHSTAFSSVAHNSRVALSIQYIEDEIFWKAIYCLLRAPTLKALQYCHANYPAMDKIFYLIHRANDAILKLAMDFDDVDLFGPMQDTEMTGIGLEMTEAFGKK